MNPTKHRLPTAAAAVLVLVALTGCGDDGDSESSDGSTAVEEASPLEDAYDACEGQQVGNPLAEDRQFPASEIMIVDDESLIVEGAGDQFASGQAGGCVLDALAAPASVRSKVESTTGLMGRQVDSWDQFEASWSFHPDNGLDLVIELVDEG